MPTKKTAAPRKTIRVSAVKRGVKGGVKGSVKGGIKKNQDIAWQAQKSAMTRDAILDATLDCFVKLGYASTTTERIAARAKVSRGAMMHHFASKSDLVRAAVQHLQGKLIDLYMTRIDELSHNLPVLQRNRWGLEGYWEYLSSDLFIAYHELCIAARTEPELKRILQSLEQRFDKAIEQSARQLFPEWSQKGELFNLAMDITKFLMEGMAVSQLVTLERDRVRRLIDYLADRLEEIFKEGDSSSAIHRHSTIK
jgi:AcrR family transcriptional regulator